jgi:hypothetical protein
VIHWVVQSLVLLLITAHDRPFVGQSGVRPTVLLEVQPDAAVGSSGR